MTRKRRSDSPAIKAKTAVGRLGILGQSHQATKNTKDGTSRAVVLKKAPIERLLDEMEGTAAVDLVNEIDKRWDKAIGCKTSEFALSILSQVMQVACPDSAEKSEEALDHALLMATARILELQPSTAVEAMLTAQMIGVQTLATTFMQRAVTAKFQNQVDSNVNNAARLMRLFTEQLEALARLKGKTGQQRVVVEHVTVAAGGQAIVGAVVPRGEMGAHDDDRQ